MKKRFRNILTRTNKKNGIILFAVIFLITFTIGATVGYAMEEPAVVPEEEQMIDREAENEDAPTQNMDELDVPVEDADLSTAATREPTTVLSFIDSEGFEDEESATLYVGEGYSFYLLDGWNMTEPNHWVATVNDRIHIWVEKYEGFHLSQVEELLMEQGYDMVGEKSSGRLYKYDAGSDTVRRVLCYETENDVWTMNSLHFLEAEEGMIVSLSLMFGTFEVTEGYQSAVLLDKTEVFIVEPIRTLDQVASQEESQKVIDVISQLTAADFVGAVSYPYFKANEGAIAEDHVMLLCQSESGNVSVYGYDSEEFLSRGIILDYNGRYSYFDYTWDEYRGSMDVYEQDFDYDGAMEIGFCFLGGHGTGVDIDRIVIFDDVNGTGSFMAYEFTPEMQMEQFYKELKFDVDSEKKELSVLKDEQVNVVLDWGRYADSDTDTVVAVDCLNQVAFTVYGNEIRMRVDIGVWLNQGGPSIFYENEQGVLWLDVKYVDGEYQIV